MQKQHKVKFLIALFVLMVMTACSADTDDWKLFIIEEEPMIDIQFKQPPGWFFDYAPNYENPGQWDVAMVPPHCKASQEIAYDENCISLTINIKDEASFDKEGFLSLVSQNITLNEYGTEESLLTKTDTLEMNGLTGQRFTHKVIIDDEDYQLTIVFLETDSAYYAFISEFPYQERRGEIADTYNLMLETIEIND